MPNRPAGERDRIERLRLARARDSEQKRARTLATTADMLTADIPVSVARVAREARVSTWLVYNVPELRAAVERAIQVQQRDGLAPSLRSPARSLSTDSLRTELALARDEIQGLRRELAKLKGRLRLQLGVEAEGLSTAEFSARLQEIETANEALTIAVEQRDDRIASLVEERATLEAELDGKSEALRRLMFAANTEN